MDNQNDFYPENDIKNQIEETSAEFSADEPVIEGEEIEEEYKFAPIIFPNTTNIKIVNKSSNIFYYLLS